MRKYILLLVFGAMIALTARGQNKYKIIPLPQRISGLNEEFSGITKWHNRLYLLPQYGSHKETKLNGDFNVYSLRFDSLSRAINGVDTGLSAYRTLKVLNLEKLPDSVKTHYEGFESIAIIDGRVFLTIETDHLYDYCFLLKGVIDTVKNFISIDPQKIITLKRPLFIKQAGFESLAYLPKQNKLLTIYEFNATAWRKTGYLIDTSFSKRPQAVSMPFQYFRITDMATAPGNKLYAINYYYTGDYLSYLNNGALYPAEADIRCKVPALRDSIEHNPAYLKTHNYAAIIMLNGYKGRKWKTVTTFEGFKNNWEGITLFDKGAIIITDANRNKKQVSIMAYVEF
jgi:hypothetical protein